MRKILELSDIVVDAKFQPRAGGLNEAHVAELAEAYKAGAEIEPPIVYQVERKGKLIYVLTQGFHRLKALELAKKKKAEFEIYTERTESDAILNAAASNMRHGLKRTNEDKKRAVLMVLDEFPDWSDRHISEIVGVSHVFVSSCRPSPLVTVTSSNGQVSAKRVGKDGISRTMPTPKPKPEPTKQSQAPQPAKATPVHSDVDDSFDDIFSPSWRPPEPEPEKAPDHETKPIGRSYTKPTTIPNVPGVYEPRFCRTHQGVEVAYDAYGTPLPNDIGDIFGSSEMRGIVGDLHLSAQLLLKAGDVYEKLSRHCQDFPWVQFGPAMHDLNKLQEQFRKVLDHFRDSVPYALCPHCHGQKCPKCRHSGYWPRRDCMAQSELFEERKVP